MKRTAPDDDAFDPGLQNAEANTEKSNGKHSTARTRPVKRFKLNRPRASIACSNCRSRKVRCSGLLPDAVSRKCDFCKERKLNCNLSEMNFESFSPTKSVLPSTELLLKVFEVFNVKFQQGGLFNFLHPDSFRQTLSAGSSSSVKELCLAMLALTVRFCDLPDLEDETSYCDEALRCVRATPDDYTLVRMQTLLLLAFFDCIENNESRGYFNLGSAIRIGQILQLETNELKPARSNRSETELSAETQEARRRTFWCAFLLERLLTDGVHRTCAIRFDPFNITIQMPASETDWLAKRPAQTARFHEDKVSTDLPVYLRSNDPSPPVNLYGFTLRIADLWAQVVAYVAIGGKLTLRLPPWHPDSGFAKLNDALADWLKALPPFLHYEQHVIEDHAQAGGQLQLFGLMHCLYFASVLYLHRDFIPFSPIGWTPSQGPIDEGKGLPSFDRSSEPYDWFRTSSDTAFRAADSVTDLVQRIPSLINNPFSGFALLTSATMHCQAYWWPQNAPVFHQSEDLLRRDVRLLLEFAQIWTIANTFCGNLNQLFAFYGSASESAHNSSAQSNRSRDAARAGVMALLSGQRDGFARRASVDAAGQAANSGEAPPKHNLFQLLNSAEQLRNAEISSFTPGVVPPVSLPQMAALPYMSLSSPSLQLAQDLFGLNSPQFSDIFAAGYSQSPFDDWSHFAMSQNPWLGLISL